MKDRLLGWLGRKHDIPGADDALCRVLVEDGVPQDAILRAAQHRFLMETRLASTLVEQGAADESTALRALCRHTGVPGIALRLSIVDVRQNGLPPAWTHERLVFPVEVTPAGVVVVASVDPLVATDLQELELCLGRPVEQRLALHLYLDRTIRAATQLQTDCPDAAFLLGANVDPDTIEGPGSRLVAVVPRTAVPEYRPPETGDAEVQPTAIVALGEKRLQQRVVSRLQDAGLSVTTMPDGQAAARAIAAAPPVLVILSAQLPGRSGFDLIRRLSSGELYRNINKVLVLPEDVRVSTGELKDRMNVLLVDSGDLDDNLSMIVSELPSPALATAIGRRAWAAFYRGQALRQEDDDVGAKQAFEEALFLDPLLGEAHLALGQIAAAQGEARRALDAFTMALDLDRAETESICSLAEMWQYQGYTNLAATLWQRAAQHTDNSELAMRLRQHAAGLVSD